MALSSPGSRRREARRNILLGSLGAALEYYDFVVYLYVATLIGAAFFPPETSDTLRLMQTFSIYSVGFLIRPIAGILIARAADRVGRKRLFVLTVVVMSVATLAIGLLPTYAQVGWPAPVLLMLMRIAQGCAVGGELPAAAVFVTEHADRDAVARAGAFQQSMAYAGFLLGATMAFLSGLVATHLVPGVPSLAWRLPFIVGGLLGVVSIYLRRKLDETPAFQQQVEEERKAGASPVREVLREHRGPVLFGALLVSVISIVNIALFTFWPTYLQTSLHIPAPAALGASLIAIAGAMASMPFWGWVADRWGWRRELLCGTGLTAAATVVLFLVLPTLPAGSNVVLWIQLPAVLGAGAIVSAVPGLVSSIFPTEVRQTGYSVSYNVVVAVLGGLMSLILVWLIAAFGLTAPMYVILFACVLTLGAALVVPRIPLYLGRGSGPSDTPARGGADSAGAVVGS
ncbi:MFS transporter [Acrocarpospora pleiomorpha]|uniref:MFS transporter n=1 Tax=Acrocarpospora pleiomorpha TaxID=90975 RepID=A0A5M3XH44_9ACTN|nr:MFS transporter [Acrocarpospora pleiomorpha]GES20847.1 MFS transporter [Acrocarpospora pleiomorpha]